MSKSEKISDAEWLIMEVVWNYAPMPSSEIVKRLGETSEWNAKTIHTLLSRLVKKEIVGVEKGKINMYFPLIAAEATKNEIAENFIQKIYNGSLELFMTNFVKNRALSKEELEKLKSILTNEKEE